MQPLNIQIFVDVIQLVLDPKAQAAVFMFDDSPQGSEGKGTSALRSPIVPGQLIRWSLDPIDVQTPIWISQIDFGPQAYGFPPPPDTPVWARSWEAFAPPYGLTCGDTYPYSLTMSLGGRGEFPVSGASLIFPSLAAPAAASPA